MQHLADLLGWLERLTAQTQPFQIREAIASHLLDLWPLVLLAGPERVAQCCRLTVGLLQDADADVRWEMAAAVSRLLAGESKNYAAIR